MKKVFVFYFAAACCLFLALFAAFTLAGFATPPPVAEQPQAAAQTATQTEPPVQGPKLDYPDLEPGLMYTVSHRTPLHADPEDLARRREDLPPGGIFLVEETEERDSDRWYRVTVNNGVNDYTMYLKAQNLNRQDVQVFGNTRPNQTATRQDVVGLFEQMEAARSRQAAGHAEANLERPPEPEAGPLTPEQVITSVRDALYTISSRGLAAAALASGVLTVCILLTILCISWLYNVGRSRRAAGFIDLASEMAEEFHDKESGPPGADDF